MNYVENMAFLVPTRKVLLSVAILTSLIGCESMSDAVVKIGGEGRITSEHSSYDNATLYTVTPASLYDEGANYHNNILMGASWSSAYPEVALLDFVYKGSSSTIGGSFVGIRSVDILIDGVEHTFHAGTISRHDAGAYIPGANTVYTSSANSIQVPYSLLQEMITADDCRVRINTTSGFENSLFSQDRVNTIPTARIALREFLAAIAGS